MAVFKGEGCPDFPAGLSVFWIEPAAVFPVGTPGRDEESSAGTAFLIGDVVTHKGDQFKAEPIVNSFNIIDFMHRWDGIVFRLCGSLFLQK